MLEHRRAEYEVELAVGERQSPMVTERHEGIAMRGGSGRGGLRIHISQTDVPAVGEDGVDMSAIRGSQVEDRPVRARGQLTMEERMEERGDSSPWRSAWRSVFSRPQGPAVAAPF